MSLAAYALAAHFCLFRYASIEQRVPAIDCVVVWPLSSQSPSAFRTQVCSVRTLQASQPSSLHAQPPRSVWLEQVSTPYLSARGGPWKTSF